MEPWKSKTLDKKYQQKKFAILHILDYGES